MKTNKSVHEAEMFTFKRWGRKSFSLFSVLKRPVRIGVLLAIYTTVAKPELVFAQTDSTRVSMEYDLEEVKISAQRAPVVFSQVARIVSVITKEDISTAPVQSIQELLEYALGVDVRQRGPIGVQADISIRGGSFDQTLILLNGINISDPQTGHHALDLPVSLKNIHRIEILEGPAARVLGPNAFSGAINIITAPMKDTNLKFDLCYGQHQLADANISGNIKTGNYHQFAAFNHSSSDGYIANTDFKTWNAFYQSRLDTKPGTLDFQVGQTNKAFGANSFYSPDYPNQYEETRTTFASVKFETGTKLHISPSVYWRRHHDRFELFRDKPASWYKGHNYHLTDVFGSNLNAWFSTGLGKTAFGAEIRSENVWSNVLGKALAEPIKVPGESCKLFTKSYSRTTISYFVEQSIHLKNLSISGGAMANRISDLSLDWNLYPGADLAYSFWSARMKIYGSINSALRMPTFTDMYYNGPKNIGNENLKPEKSTGYEGGLKYASAGISAHAGIYYRKGKNLIDWVRENESEKWQTKNLTRINSTGFEFGCRLIPGEIWKSNIPITKIGINYTYTKLKKSETYFFSNYVLDNLKHKLDIELSHKIWSKLQGTWRASYQDRNGMRTKTDPYEPFWQVNTRLSWRTPSTEIYATASNLFDTEYFDMGTIKQPGRWISIGISHQINFK